MSGEKLFLSHAHTDKDPLQELRKALEERGFPCWEDVREFRIPSTTERRTKVMFEGGRLVALREHLRPSKGQFLGRRPVPPGLVLEPSGLAHHKLGFPAFRRGSQHLFDVHPTLDAVLGTLRSAHCDGGGVRVEGHKSPGLTGHGRHAQHDPFRQFCASEPSANQVAHVGAAV